MQQNFWKPATLSPRFWMRKMSSTIRLSRPKLLLPLRSRLTRNWSRIKRMRPILISPSSKSLGILPFRRWRVSNRLEKRKGAILNRLWRSVKAFWRKFFVTNFPMITIFSLQGARDESSSDFGGIYRYFGLLSWSSPAKFDRFGGRTFPRFSE